MVIRPPGRPDPSPSVTASSASAPSPKAGSSKTTTGPQEMCACRSVATGEDFSTPLPLPDPPPQAGEGVERRETGGGWLQRPGRGRPPAQSAGGAGGGAASPYFARRAAASSPRPSAARRDGSGGLGQGVAGSERGFGERQRCRRIASVELERDAGGKPVPTFPHPALGAVTRKAVCPGRRRRRRPRTGDDRGPAPSAFRAGRPARRDASRTACARQSFRSRQAT